MTDLTETSSEKKIIDALLEQGYGIFENLVPDSLLQELLQFCRHTLPESFHSAGIGRQQNYNINTNIRSDKIFWLTPDLPITQKYNEWLEPIRLAINSQLYLGLFDYECHFAQYPIGANYAKHLDSFQGKSNRMVSTILYLNETWEEENGGHLVIYSPKNNSSIQVLPTLGKFVIFLSQEFPHEVLPSTKTRQSLTGWFRVRS